MPRLNLSVRKRVIVLKRAGYSLKDIWTRIQEEEDCIYSLRSVYRLWSKFREHHTILDLPRKKRDRKINEDMLETIETLLTENDELTARHLKERLSETWPSLNISLTTIKRAQKEKGWVSTQPHYCQLLREANKIKRVEWCKQQMDSKEQFKDVIFTDECSVQLERHSRLCFRKRHQPRALKQRPKHPLKVHIWGGISYQGATKIVIFTGIMNAVRYSKILDASLLQFIRECYPNGHRLQQDNDPKHTSKFIERYFAEKNINWWKTSAESPDLNPIENVWGSLKQFLSNDFKPKNLDELKSGIQQFWSTLTPEICQNYINHLHKVMPKVVAVGGEPSGY